MAEVDFISAEEEAELKAQERGRLAALATQRTILTRQLTQRFGARPRELAARIEACDDKNQLHAALDQVLTVTTLQQFQL